MNITIPQYELQFTSCFCPAVCDCSATSYSVTVHGTVHEGLSSYDPEILSIEGLPPGMAISDLDPVTTEDIINELHDRAANIRAQRKAVLGEVQSALRLLRTTDDRELGFRLREAIRTLTHVEEAFS